jgi:hypothetical protein
VFAAALPANHVPKISSGNITIVYGWSAGNIGSQIIAKQITALAPIGATIVGVNTDTDVTKANAIVISQAFPGAQLFDAAGIGSKVAQALFLNDDSIVVITNGTGVIVTVTGRIGLAAKIQSAENQ